MNGDKIGRNEPSFLSSGFFEVAPLDPEAIEGYVKRGKEEKRRIIGSRRGGKGLQQTDPSNPEK